MSEDLRARVFSVLRKNINESGEGTLVVIRVEEGDEEALFIESDELVFKTPIKSLTGRENAALISFLSRTLKIPSSKIDIVYGVRERVKRVLISDIDPDDLITKLLRVVRLI
ncbi:MAG: DUF167 domain-containing protein [Desulfurococcaceae archaeon]|nr:DUF167 domain-containing protein [Desulfurococcaceae archaeon]